MTPLTPVMGTRAALLRGLEAVADAIGISTPSIPTFTNPKEVDVIVKFKDGSTVLVKIKEVA